MINRVQLKEAMIANKDKLNMITYIHENIPLPQTPDAVAYVMDTLNSINNGTIQKNEFKKALVAFNNENKTDLHVDSIVKEVFTDKPTLVRSVIREKMNQNPDIQDLIAAEPIQEQIMRDEVHGPMQLESIPSSTITLKDLYKAVAVVQRKWNSIDSSSDHILSQIHFQQC